MKIVMHSKTQCPYCDQAKDYLSERGIPYEVVVHDDFDERQAFYDSLGLTDSRDRFVPQILVFEPDGRFDRIAGVNGPEGLFASDLAARHAAGTFDEDF